jgi:hypothetical protein
MTAMRWQDYVLAYGDEIEPLWRAAGVPGRACLFVLGAGFDPRATVGLQAFATTAGRDSVTVALVALPAGRGEPAALALAERNADLLVELARVVGFRVERVAYPTNADQRGAGQAISRRLQSAGLIDPSGLVIVDVSALPASIAFPIIGGMLAAGDRGAFNGDLQVLVCENPQIDRAIIEEGAADAGPVAGFAHGLTESSRDDVRIWAPVLGERQAQQLEAIFGYLEPDEIIPVLPFPAADPRRGDELVVELRELLFARMQVQPGDFMYAHERNPFDVYRSLWRLSERYRQALAPLGSATVVTSVHGSKMLSMGVLLAAWERKLPVVTTAPTDYLIASGVDLDRLAPRSRLACLWLLGDPYR